MVDYQEPIGEHTPAWPYPVDYGKEHHVSADVLILGGGIAGCHAAINAAKKGARVVVVDRGDCYFVEKVRVYMKAPRTRALRR